MPDCTVLIFAKTPGPGQVKTRLIPALGEAGANRLYCDLLQREIAWISRETPHEIELWVTPDEQHPLFQDLRDRHGLTLHLQQGGDLGARMGFAAERTLARRRRALLLGVDCPALTAAHLEQTHFWLQAGEDAVLGPAKDGGYVLLGLNRFDWRIFQGHTWGGADVAETTRRAMHQLGWRWRELPTLGDLDRPDDLAQLPSLGIEIPSKVE